MESKDNKVYEFKKFQIETFEKGGSKKIRDELYEMTHEYNGKGLIIDDYTKISLIHRPAHPNTIYAFSLARLVHGSRMDVHVDLIYVDEEQRGKGYGRVLAEKIVSDFPNTVITAQIGPKNEVMQKIAEGVGARRYIEIGNISIFPDNDGTSNEDWRLKTGTLIGRMRNRLG